MYTKFTKVLIKYSIFLIIYVNLEHQIQVNFVFIVPLYSFISNINNFCYKLFYFHHIQVHIYCMLDIWSLSHKFHFFGMIENSLTIPVTYYKYNILKTCGHFVQYHVTIIFECRSTSVPRENRQRQETDKLYNVVSSTSHHEQGSNVQP